MKKEKEESALVEVIQESGLEVSQSEHILSHFTDFFEKAKEWETKAKTIQVTDVSQKKEMSEARDARLALKDIRVNAEKTRKELKEASLREGKAIDGIANIIKMLIVPIEEYLEKQEKFAEEVEKAEKEKKLADRIAKLSEYVEDISLYSLADMTDEVFEKLLENSKTAYQAKKDAEKKVEEERLAKIEEEKKEQERIRTENEKLKKDAEKREAELAKERAENEKKLEAEREKTRKEAEAREKLEKEAREKKEKEDREKHEKEEAERQAKLAPEKDKILAFAEAIKMIESPQELSKAGMEIVKAAEKKLLELSQEIKLQIKNL